MKKQGSDQFMKPATMVRNSVIKMSSKSLIPAYNKFIMSSERTQSKNICFGSISRSKQNQCVIYMASATLPIASVEKRHQSWFFNTKTESDLIVQVGDNTFHLHKLPMVSKSGYLNRLVFQKTSNGPIPTNIYIDNLPGGTEIFHIVLKYCYGRKIDVTPTNIAPLYCAAHLLEMSDDLEEHNLISQTESFLSFLILSSWKETFTILRSCESVSTWAQDLKILKRCSDAIAWKACTNKFGNDDMAYLDFLYENPNKPDIEKLEGDWWFEDVSSLRLDHFIEVILSIKKKGMSPNLIGSCIAYWTFKWVSTIKQGQENETPNIQLQKEAVECLIRILPTEENSVSFNFLLHLLKLGLAMKISFNLFSMLITKAVFALEKCRAIDLLVQNNEVDGASYDVEIVAKVVEAYLLYDSNNQESNIFVIGRLIDDYLALVARDENLRAKSFQLIVEALPRNARQCDDNLYRAIDMYLKAHPELIEEERSGICRTLEYYKLSQEARKHAMKNERLSFNIITRFVLLEQINITREFTASGSNYQRTKSQVITRIGEGLEKDKSLCCQKEIKMMKQEVERVKMQLCEVKLQKMQIQRKLRRQKLGYISLC